MKKTIGGLTPTDLGKMVTVALPDGGAMRGMLTGLQGEVDRIERQTFAGDDGAVPGGTTARITVGWWESPPVDLDTAVEVEEA